MDAQLQDMMGTAAASRAALPPPLVALSGEESISLVELGGMLADRLGVRCYDPETVDSLVLQSQHRNRHLRGGENGVDTLLPQRELSHILDGLVRPFRESNALSSQIHYLVHLAKVVAETTREGGVIVGRGAHLILSGEKVFRMKVEAGPDYCARRLAQEEGLPLDEARDAYRQSRKDQIRFTRSIFELFPNEGTYYDLVLNAEVLKSAAMVEIIIAAMEVSGYRLPEVEQQKALAALTF